MSAIPEPLHVHSRGAVPFKRDLLLQCLLHPRSSCHDPPCSSEPEPVH